MFNVVDVVNILPCFGILVILWNYLTSKLTKRMTHFLKICILLYRILKYRNLINFFFLLKLLNYTHVRPPLKKLHIQVLQTFF